MKKILSIAAVCALLVACNGKNNVDEPVVDYPQQENAGAVVFTANNPQVNVGDQSARLEKINHYANGIYEADAAMGVANPPQVGKRNLSVQKLIGRFVASAGSYSYTSGPLVGGTLTKMGDGSFNFNFGNKSGSASGTFTPNPKPTDPVASALCGAHWKLSSIVGKVKSKNIKLSYNDLRGINPNNVEAVAQDINTLAGEEIIPMKKVSGYVIKAISLNLNPNKVIVEFEDGKDPIEGTWDAGLVAKSFSYNLNADLDGQLFDADGSGSFDFADNNNTLIITMTVKSSSDIADIIIKAKKVN